jgi:hypothetical protein
MTKNAKLKAVPDLEPNPFAFLSEDWQIQIADWQNQGWTVKKDAGNFWAASKNFGHESDLELEGYQSLEGLFRDMAETETANTGELKTPGIEAKPENIINLDSNSPVPIDEQLEAQNGVIEDFVKENIEVVNDGLAAEAKESESEFDFSEVEKQRKIDAERETTLDAENEIYLDQIHVYQALGAVIPKDARIYENCAVRLTKEEKAILSEDSMSTLNKLDEVNRQLASVKAQYTAEIKELTAKSTRLRHIVTSGFEYRDVECFERYDHEKNLVRIIRRDTFALVRTRQMTAKERQRSFF